MDETLCFEFICDGGDVYLKVDSLLFACAAIAMAAEGYDPVPAEVMLATLGDVVAEMAAKCL